jgi:hypothetical protein
MSASTGEFMTPQEAFDMVFDTMTETAPHLEGPLDEILLLLAKLSDLLADASCGD